MANKVRVKSGPSGIPRFKTTGYDGGLSQMVKDVVKASAYAAAPRPLKTRKKVIDRASNY